MENEEFKPLTSGEVLKLEIGQSIVGTYEGISQSIQFPKSYAFKVKVVDELQVVFVSNIVKELIENHNVKQGERVKLTFKGKVKNKQGTFSYNDYELSVAR